MHDKEWSLIGALAKGAVFGVPMALLARPFLSSAALGGYEHLGEYVIAGAIGGALIFLAAAVLWNQYVRRNRA